MWQNETHQFLHFYIFFDYAYVRVHVVYYTIQTTILRKQNFAVHNVTLSKHDQKVISVFFSQKNTLLIFNL